MAFLTFNQTFSIEFQYKIIHNIVATNRNIYVWQLRDNDRCNYCEKSDSLVHCLQKCKTTKQWLNQCLQLWPLKDREEIEIVEFLMGSKIPAINLIFLIAKFLFWKTRFNANQFNIYAYKAQIKLRLQNEHKMMTANTFARKWGWGNLSHLMK